MSNLQRWQKRLFILYGGFTGRRQICEEIVMFADQFTAEDDI